MPDRGSRGGVGEGLGLEGESLTVENSGTR